MTTFAVRTKPRPRTRRTRTRAIVGTVVGGILVSGTAAAVALLVAAISRSWLASVATTIVIVLALPSVMTLLRQWRRARRSSASGAVQHFHLWRTLATSGVALVVTLLWIWPHAAPVTASSPPDATLVPTPDGTKLVVHVTRAPSTTRPPLVVVHGGPGVADMTHDVAALGRLARDRDVYVYDQLGAGASDRLADPRGYTDHRALDDLDRVVQMTGEAEVVLLGHSWGARFVTKYAAAHPNRVSALILSAPGSPPSTDAKVQPAGDPTKRLDTGQRLRLYGHLLRPRNLFTYALSQVDPAVAHEAASDTEMDARFANIYRQTTPALFCDPRLTGRLGVTGVGYYSHHALTSDVSPLYDSSMPAHLRGPVTTPTLIIKPACDYLPWAVISAHKSVVPDARVVVLPDAGHQAYLETPDAYAELVSAFMANRPLPQPVVDATIPPPSYRGVR